MSGAHAGSMRLVNLASGWLWRCSLQGLSVDGDLSRSWIRKLWILVPASVQAMGTRLDMITRCEERHALCRVHNWTQLTAKRSPIGNSWKPHQSHLQSKLSMLQLPPDFSMAR